MARRGAFGSSLSPFGGGTLGSLAQYDVGADLADLSVYQTEVAWGNGQATDQDYLNALRQSVAAADPTTQRYYSAQNKLDDAVYRIGRSQAEAGGLDALIAFDQAALTTMDPSNLRYRDVKDSLDSELAQRRSRDYGELVTAYNSGDLPTEALLGWVSATLGTISPDDPDFDNWTNVRSDLDGRIEGEKDTAAFQDYQRGRLPPQAFLAYLTQRRDSYNPNSPKYQEWADKLEDATVQIKEAAQSKADSAFFALYNEGKKSDASYLLYLRRRIDGMPADDPQRAEWQHRLNQSAFSLAEDKLRFDAQRATDKVDRARNPSATSIRAANAATGKLLEFYTSYRSTLNPGSAEWRTVTRSVDALTRQLAAPAPKPRRGTGTAGGTAGSAPGTVVGGGPALAAGGKLISPKYTLSSILGLFSISPTGEKKAVSAATKYLALNKSSLDNALNRGDDVWLFHDPRTPNAVVAALNPDGSPMLDGQGKPVVRRGSAYLPVSSAAMSNIKMVEGNNFLANAELALARGKLGDQAMYLRRAAEAFDSARLTDAQYRGQNWEDWYKATEIAVAKQTMAGDYGGAVRTASDLAARLAREAGNSYLDDTRRARLEEIGEKLADNPLMPTADAQGNPLYEGAVNLSELARGNVVLNPGWHHELKSNDRGQPAWGPVFDKFQDGRWEDTHVTVYTTLGNRLVTGDAIKSTKSKLNPLIRVYTPDGYKDVRAGGTAEMLSFVDEYGLVQRAYSLDGQTWIRPAPGMPAPTIEVNAQLEAKVDAQGVISYIDVASGEVVLAENGAGGWELGAGYKKLNPRALGWYGQAAWEQARKTPAGKQALEFDDVSRERRRPNIVDATQMDMGGINQHMTLAYASPSGIVNLTPAGFRTQNQIVTDKRRARRPAPSPGVQFGPPRPAPSPTNTIGAKAEGGVDSRTPSVFGSAADARRRRARPTTYDDIAAQLPADTPPRYDGYSSLPPSPVVSRLAPTRVLPALTPPPAYALGEYVPRPVVALRPVLRAALGLPIRTASTVKKPPPPPVRVSQPAHDLADARRVASTKPPPPPPVKTPTATPGVYRPPSVTTSGPLR